MRRATTSRVLLLVLLGLAGCAGMPERSLRNYSNISCRAVLEEALKGFKEENYSIEDQRFVEGYVTAWSPVATRHLLWLVPWRKEQWLIRLDAHPHVQIPNVVELTGHIQIFESGVLPGSEMAARKERSGDSALARDLMNKLDKRLRAAGAIPE